MGRLKSPWVHLQPLPLLDGAAALALPGRAFQMDDKQAWSLATSDAIARQLVLDH